MADAHSTGDKLGVTPLARKYQSIMQDFAGSAQLNPRDSPRRPIAKGLGRLAGQISKPTGSLVPRVSRPTALRVRGIRILHLTRGLEAYCRTTGELHPRLTRREPTHWNGQAHLLPTTSPQSAGVRQRQQQRRTADMIGVPSANSSHCTAIPGAVRTCGTLCGHA